MSQQHEPIPGQSAEGSRADPALLYRQRCEAGQAPDLTAFLREAGPLGCGGLCAVLRADQEFRWPRGQGVPAEDYLRRFPAVGNSEDAALDLISGEYVLRQRLGPTPTVEEYLGRFPERAERLRARLERGQATASAGPAPPLPPCGPPGGKTVAEAPTTLTLDADGAPPGGPPRRIGGYEVLGEIGRGTFGVVYRARDPRLARNVAIKVLLAGSEASADERARFQAEVEAVGGLQHSNIVQVYDTGEYRGAPYLVMELVEGGSLAAHLGGQPRRAREAAQLVEALARAVQAAHDKGIVHRDLKPANVLLAGGVAPAPDEGPALPEATSLTGLCPKITDFGLAKRVGRSLGLSQTGQAIGTPSYMAPEQASGKVHEVGPRADVYALGAILYELLTGRPPFRGPDVLAVLDQVCNSEPLSPSQLVPKLPRDLCTICLKCLEKEQQKRYASAASLADDLRRFLDGHEIVARPPGALEYLWRLVRRYPWQAALATAGAVVVALAAAVFVQNRNATISELRRGQAEERREREQIQREKEAERRQFMEEEYAHSMEALDGIRKLVVMGKLGNRPGLEPLHVELLGHYGKLIERQKASGLASREKLAGACFSLGQLMSKAGQTDKAVAAFDQAEKLYRQLAGSPGQGPKVRPQMAKAVLERARLHEEMGQAADARKDYESARALLLELVKDSPAGSDCRRDLGEALHGLAVLGSDEQKDFDQASKLFDEALQLRKRLCEVAPGERSRRDLARTYGYQGDLLLKMGRLPKADLAYWRSHRIRQQLAEEKGGEADREEAKFQLARSYRNLAGLQARMGALSTASYFLGESLKLRQALVRDSQAVTAYHLDLGEACNGAAELLLLAQDEPSWRQQALGLAQQAEEIFATQKKGNEKSPRVQLGLVQARTLRARLVADEPVGKSQVDEVRAILAPTMPEMAALLRQRETGESLYQGAMISALMSERLEGEPGDVSKGQRAIALARLEQAYKKGFCRLHPDDVRRDRAFAKLRGAPEFEKIFAELGKP